MFRIAVLVFATLISFLGAVYLGLFQEPPKAKLSSNEPQFGGNYLRAIPGKPKTLDPAFCTDTTVSEIVGQLYSRLFRMNNDLKVVSDIAQSFVLSPDKRTYRFKLRRKVRFHTITEKGLLSANQGREVQASDVKFTFERILDPKVDSPNKSLLELIAGAGAFSKGKSREVTGIRVLGEHEFEIRLRNPFSPFLHVLTTAALGIVPHEDVTKWGKEFKNHPVGSGAFIFDGFRSDDGKKLVLRSNLDFHRGRPFLDQIEFRFVSEDYLQFQEFEQNKIFHLDRIPTRYLKDSIKNGHYLFEERPALQVTYLGMNMTLPPFHKKPVRKAMNHAINRNLIIRHILQNRGIIAKGPLPRGLPGYNPSLEPYGFDLDKARAYLAQGGYEFDEKGMVKNFDPLHLQVPPSEVSRAIGGIVQANLADLGIHLKLNIVPWNKHFESIDNNLVSFFSLGWLADYPDPDNILYSNFHSSSIASSYNSARFSHPRVDQLLEKARSTGNEENRLALYRKVEEIITEEAPWIFLHYPTTYVLVQPYVHGIQLSALGASEIDYFKVWLSKPESSGG